MKALKIGNIELKNPLILAPMVDVTDLPYRLICRGVLSDVSAVPTVQRPDRPLQRGQHINGCGMAYTEMLYVDAILHSNNKTEMLMKTCKEDSPVGLQITGNSVAEFEKFVKSGKWKKFDLIDLNCGCPSLRITGNKAGGYLLKNPEKIREIVRVLKKTGKPITVKIRLGFKRNNVLEVARAVADSGADALTVHARLAVHGRDVPADWKWIKKMKEATKLSAVRAATEMPIIGNGDVFSGEDAKRMLEICDGVMIARGATGDPLIFDRINDYLETGKEREVNAKDNLKLYLRYLDLSRRFYGKDVDLGRVKYLGGKFLRGFSGAGKARQELMKCKGSSEIRKSVLGELRVLQK